MFIYEKLPRYDIREHDRVDGRWYFTPDGSFCSVTTILKEKLSNKKLEEWREEVGEDEANQISFQSSSRGKIVHQALENYLKGVTFPEMKTPLMPSHKAMYLEAKKILDSRITKVYGVEFPLYSKQLKAAGRTDALVEWLYQNVVLDFKTTNKNLDNSDERIYKYNLQTTAYAMMAEEMYSDKKFPYNVLVLLPMYDHPQIIIKTNDKYRSIVKKLFINSNEGV